MARGQLVELYLCFFFFFMMVDRGQVGRVFVFFLYLCFSVVFEFLFEFVFVFLRCDLGSNEG